MQLEMYQRWRGREIGLLPMVREHLQVSVVLLE